MTESSIRVGCRRDARGVLVIWNGPIGTGHPGKMRMASEA